MKKTTKLLILIFFILGVIVSIFCSKSYAAEQKTINAKGIRDTYSYAFMDKNGTFQRILKLYEVNNQNADFLTYCARGGLGFGGNSAIHELTYSQIADLKREPATAISKYNEFFNVNLNREQDIMIEYSFNKAKFNETTNNEKERYENLKSFLQANSSKITYTTTNENSLEFGTENVLAITVTYKDVNIYNTILSLLDNMYLPKNIDVIPTRAIWLKKAGLEKSTITDEQIDSTQQMALWYLTNSDATEEPASLFSFTTKASILANKMKYSRIELTTKENLSLSDFEDNVSEDLGILYSHLLTNAVQDSYKYETEGNTRTEVTPKIEFADTTTKLNINNSKVIAGSTYYLIGPFKIENSGSNKFNNFNYSLVGIDNTGKETVLELDKSEGKVIITDTNGVTVFNGDVEDKIGNGEFYIRVLKNVAFLPEINVYNISNFRLEFSYEYFNTEASLWTTESHEDQPVIIVNRTKQTDDDKISTSQIEGKFNLKILKVDATDKTKKLTGSNFTIEDVSRQKISLTNNNDGTFVTGNIDIKSKDDKFTYTITEVTAPVGYKGIETPIEIEITAKEVNGKYVIDTAILKTSIEGVSIKVSEDGTTIEVTVENEKVKQFDLALRKYITAVNDKEVTNKRELNNIDTSKLNVTDTTAIYKHRKDPVQVNTGDVVDYTFRVYNEGEIAGEVTAIKDYLPEGVELYTEGLTKVDSQDENIEIWEKKENNAASDGTGLYWTYTYEYNKTTHLLEIKYSIYGNEMPNFENLGITLPSYNMFKLNPFNSTQENKTVEQNGWDGKTGWINGLNYGELTIKLKVTAESADTDKILTNIATMEYSSTEKDENGKGITDRDSSQDNFNKPGSLVSNPGYTGEKDYTLKDLEDNEKFYEGQEDDDDFEKLIIKGANFDLSLRKFITEINGEKLETDRTPSIDLTTLVNGTVNEKGKTEYTATYTHPKNTVTVHKGDIVKYTIRVYNEGEVDGFATEVSDYLPAGLGLLVEYNDNINNYWAVSEATTATLVGETAAFKKAEQLANLKIEDFTGITSLEGVHIATGKITTTFIKDEKILAYDKTAISDGIGWQKAEVGEGGLFYKDIEVSCIVLAENTFKGELVNIAEISEDKAIDENNNELSIEDRDSTPDNVDTNNYDLRDENSTYQEDDDDYEPLSLKYFDLALRKFITKVNDKAPEVSREPVVDTTPLINGTDTTAKYNHTKDPLYVANGDEVEYTIRVYNEGSMAGYAYEIADDIPEGLIFDPKNETNIKYGWKMYKIADEDSTDYDLEYNDKKYVETEDASEATMIRTRYLDTYLIRAFNSETKVLDYGDVKVVFTIDENYTDTTRTIKNEAQITEDSNDDVDSEPNKWQNEDDEDVEYVYVQYFDLSLLKWVTKSIVTVDGVTTTTETGFNPNTGLTETTGIRENSEAEPVAKVEVNRKKINDTVVKFVYKIRVTNEGSLAGYATEITDYIPKGLAFYAEDNKAFGWVLEGDDKVTTRALETVLLQPRESSELEIVFRWINGKDNLGLKTNIAEISEDYSENDDKSPDIDSNPEYIDIENYVKEQEDDDDFALVILSITTGGENVIAYTTLIGSAIVILATGIILIKKYVLI